MVPKIDEFDKANCKTMLDACIFADGLLWAIVSWWKNALHEHFTTLMDDDNMMEAVQGGMRSKLP